MPDLPNLAKPDYVVRVNRAIDHITQNLEGPLDLETLAKVARFSPYHFHRVWSTLMGETLATFVKRLRLERAVYLMSHGRNKTLTEVALASGFSSSSDFSRSFRAQFGVPPSAFDEERFRAEGRRQMQMTVAPPGEQARLSALPLGENPDHFTARLVDLPKRRVAYRRALNPYTSDGVSRATEQLLNGARAQGLQGGQWLGYQWEDPELVPLEKCRYDVGLVVPCAVALDGGVSEITFEAMRVAEIEISGPIELEMRALDWLYRTWLPSSQFMPAHQPCFEAWDREPFTHENQHFELRLQLPVVPLR